METDRTPETAAPVEAADQQDGGGLLLKKFASLDFSTGDKEVDKEGQMNGETLDAQASEGTTGAFPDNP